METRTRRLISYDSLLPPGKRSFSNTILFDASRRQLWMSSIKYGICCFDIRSNTFYYRDHHPRNWPVFDLGEPTGTIFLDSRHCLWIATYTEKLFRYNIETREIGQVLLDKANADSGIIRGKTGKIAVDCMIEDRNGDVWLGARRLGLLQYSYRTDRFQAFRSNLLDPRGLHYQEGPGPLYPDKEGNIWVGGDMGLNKLPSRSG